MPSPSLPNTLLADQRTYRVEYHRDLHPGPSGYGTTGLDWRVYTYGPGHWCVGEGHSGTYRTEAEAIQAGEDWIQWGGKIPDLPRVTTKPVKLDPAIWGETLQEAAE